MNLDNDYDTLRNLTLMFFLDRLMDGHYGGSRSLHDLSCLFGTRGFTKEMRAIAGGSQSGLRKFFAKYPAIFTIDGDQVSITKLRRTSANNVEGDYEREAVEYFKSKLRLYGEAEVPLKTLMGHRSQATAPVRHLSGTSSTDFRDFLVRHPADFSVSGDHVILAEVLARAEGVGGHGRSSITRLHLDEPPPDPYLVKQILKCIEESLLKQQPNGMSVENLFNHITTRATSELANKLFKSLSDLQTFLKMHSRLFTVARGVVKLADERSADIENGRHASRPERKASEGSLSGRRAARSAEQVSSGNSSETFSPPPSLPVLNVSPTHQRPHHEQNGNERTNSYAHDRSGFRHANTNVNGNRNGNGSGASLGDRMRHQILRVVSQNNNSHSPRRSMDANGMGNERRNGGAISLATDPVAPRIQIICRLKEGKDIVSEILNSADKGLTPVVGLDTEGVSITTSTSDGQLTLIQIALLQATEKAAEGVAQVYLFDILSEPRLVTEGRLKELLESEQVVKVVHDVRTSSAALYRHLGIGLKSVFDTQVAHAVVLQQNLGLPAYKAKYVSLGGLCEIYCRDSWSSADETSRLVKRDNMKAIYRREPYYWSKRPITEDMATNAAAHVTALVTAGLYSGLRAAIRDEYLPLLAQLSYEAIWLKIKPDEVALLKRARKTDFEVMSLKQRLYATDAKQVVLSNREIRLLRYIDLTDDIRAKIEAFHKVAKKLDRMERKPNDEKSMECSENGAKEDSIEWLDDDADGDDDSDAKEGRESQYHEGDSGSFDSYNTQSTQSTHNPLSVNLDARAQARAGQLFSPTDSLISSKTSPSSTCCHCCCHASSSISATGANSMECRLAASGVGGKVEAAVQTISTGDIVVTTVYFDDQATQTA